MAKERRVVIVGGGFGGLYAARRLNGADIDLTLVDRRNFHLFQPLLYQVATGGLSPGDVASPLRAVLSRQQNARVIQAEVVDFDLDARRVILKDGELPYDILVLAAGSQSHYFGHAEWEPSAPSLKTIEDALEVRNRIFTAFETAERETDPEARRACLTFVVVGGGPTGVELAGAVGELAQQTLRHDFRSFSSADARIILLEGGKRVLEVYPEDLSIAAAESLRRLGVEVRTGQRLTEVLPGAAKVSCGADETIIPTRTILWAAGMQASPLAKRLAEVAGMAVDRGGRIAVAPDLTLPGRPEVYVIGDAASFSHTPDGKPLPGVAPVAIQQGQYVAERIRHAEITSPDPFVYKDKGTLAVIGRNAAVAWMGNLHLKGVIAWLVWTFVHLQYLIEFDNKVRVMVEWGWSYLTRNRGARLITPETPASPTSPLPGPQAAPEATPSPTGDQQGVRP